MSATNAVSSVATSFTPGIVPGADAVGANAGEGALPKPLDHAFGKIINQSSATAGSKSEVAAIGNDAVQAHCRAFFPIKQGELDQTKTKIQQEIDDPSTPPDLKAGLQNLKSVMDGDSPTFNNEQMGTISTLQRHRDAFPIKMNEIQKKIDDPKTPPDLKAALEHVRDDPTLAIALDATNRGGGLSNSDGVLSDRDLDRLGELPAMKAFNESQAKNYVQNYIPSDADPSVKGARAMTANDAAREFYLYSDNLPGRLNREALKDIVDGQAKCKKCPPQVMAAAQFYRDHPAEWDKLTADGGLGKADSHGSVSRSHMLDNISKSVYLNANEKETLETLDKNRDVFFATGLTRDSLKKIVDDPNSKAPVKKAAEQLLADPLLFGMLDNGKKGHSTSLTKSADDGKIGEADLDAFMAHLTTKDKTQPELPPIHAAKTPAEKSALADMQAGQVDDPELKKEKGGGLLHFLRSAISPFLKIASTIEHALSIALSVLAKIPIIGIIAAPLSMAAEGMAGGMDILNAGIKGEDMKKAAIMAGVGIAGALVGLVVVGGGAMLAKTLASGIEKTVVGATTKGVEKGAERGATGGATAAAKDGSTTAAGSVAKKEGADQAEQQAAHEAKNEWKGDLKDTATETVTDVAVTRATNGGGGTPPMAVIQQPMSDAGFAAAEAERSLSQGELARLRAEASKLDKNGQGSQAVAAKNRAVAAEASQGWVVPDAAGTSAAAA